MSNGYIVAHEFTNVDSTAGGMYAALDQTVQAPKKYGAFLRRCLGALE